MPVKAIPCNGVLLILLALRPKNKTKNFCSSPGSPAAMYGGHVNLFQVLSMTCIVRKEWRERRVIDAAIKFDDFERDRFRTRCC